MQIYTYVYMCVCVYIARNLSENEEFPMAEQKLAVLRLIQLQNSGDAEGELLRTSYVKQ